MTMAFKRLFAIVLILAFAAKFLAAEGEESVVLQEMQQQMQGPAPLQFIHSPETIQANPNFEGLNNLPTQNLIDSLAPSAENPLQVAPDGRIFDGNTRTFILQNRGVDINSLPRTLYQPFNPADYGGL
jgi:hypothetical protein